MQFSMLSPDTDNSLITVHVTAGYKPTDPLTQTDLVTDHFSLVKANYQVFNRCCRYEVHIHNFSLNMSLLSLV